MEIIFIFLLNLVISMSFYSKAFILVIRSLGNSYSDNWDYYRFGLEPKNNKNRLKKYLKRVLNKSGIVQSKEIFKLINKIDTEILPFQYLYDRLEDQHSRDLLVHIFAFRLLGYKKVKLPLNTSKYWNDISNLKNLYDENDFIDPGFAKFRMYRFDLGGIGFPIQLYFTPMGVLVDFIIKQYEFTSNQVEIGAMPGDVVIDGGGCWGDTSLFFANAVGEKGKVFSFEFISSNIKLFQRNLKLNPNLEKIIELVPHPLWENSNTELYVKENGPASRVSLDEFVDHTGIIKTMSIDDLVSKTGLTKLDFIKLDIEGAELMALKGAENSLKLFKPRLAIALYHFAEDFESIPKFLDGLNLGYKFYLSHCTIHEEETILFAISEYD